MTRGEKRVRNQVEEGEGVGERRLILFRTQRAIDNIPLDFQTKRAA